MANQQKGRKASPLGERLRAAIAYFRHGWPAVAPASVKDAPFRWPSWRSGMPAWSIVNVENYVREGFELNSIIYSAIMYKARANTSAPLRAFRGTPEDKEPLGPDHPLSRLLQRPNPWMGWNEFQSINVVYLNLIGNVFIYMDRRRRAAGLPEAMWSLRPDRVAIIPDDQNGLKGYLYIPEGKTWQDGFPILPQDLMHVKLPNPNDPLEGLGWGLSPVAPMARSADVDNKATEFLKLFFDHGAMIPGVLSFDVPMTPEDVAAARERWMEIYGGVENWTDVAVLDQGGTYQRVGLAFDEMGFEAIDSRNEARILGPFGVPPILIGSRYGLEHATYSNYEQARKAFWEDTLLPELSLFETEFQFYLNDGPAFVMFDTSGVPALKQDIAALVQSAQQLWTMGVPLDIAAATVGLKLSDKVEGGDVGWLPLSVQTVKQKLEPPKPVPAPLAEAAGRTTDDQRPTTEPPEDNMEGAAEATEPEQEERRAHAGPGERKGLTPDQKALLWKQTDNVARSWEPEFARAAGKCFERDRREVLAMLGGEKSAAKAAKRTIDYGELMDIIFAYFEGGSQEQWRKTFRPVIEALIEQQGEMLNAAFGMQFDVENILATESFNDYIIKFAQQIAKTTNDDITALLQKAMREGWSIPKMQEALGTLFDRYMDDATLTEEQRAWFEERMPAYRRENIARTETIRASNTGSYELYKGWGAPYKEWLATADDRTRPDHQVGSGWGQPYVIPIDEAFVVGGESLQYPGDPAGSAGNVCNCRCTVLPVLEAPQATA